MAQQPVYLIFLSCKVYDDFYGIAHDVMTEFKGKLRIQIFQLTFQYSYFQVSQSIILWYVELYGKPGCHKWYLGYMSLLMNLLVNCSA